jgi:hypothetical protein
MAALAAEHRAARAPSGVERAVMAEFEASRRRRVWRMAAVGGAIAAMLVAGFASLGAKSPVQHSAAAVAARANVLPTVVPLTAVVEKRVPRVTHARKRLAVAETPVRQERPFVAIPYTVPLAPEERATVMRVGLSPSAIAAVGFPLPAVDPGNQVEADLLVGEDGRAHAIRIVDRQE